MRQFHVVAALVCMAGIAVPLYAADEPDELMPGRIVIIKSGKLAKFIAKPPTGTTFDLPDATNDPTAEGGLLEVFDDSPFTPAGVDFVLPAGGWKGLGSPAGSKGFKYTAAGSPGDPCRVVLVKAKAVKAVCSPLWAGQAMSQGTRIAAKQGGRSGQMTDPRLAREAWTQDSQHLVQEAANPQ